MAVACDREVGMGGGIAPIGEGRIPVDAHRRDVRIGEQVVEGEVDRRPAIADMGAVFGPVGRIDQGYTRPGLGAHLGGENPQRRHRRVTGGPRTRVSPTSSLPISSPATRHPDATQPATRSA